MKKTETVSDNKKQIKKLLIAVAIIAWVLLIVSMAVLADGRGVRFYMTGSDKLTLEYGTDFEDPGVYAVTAGRLFGEGKKHLPVESSGSVDSGRLGEYRIRYTAQYAFTDYSTERLVTVKDTKPPVITLKTVEGYLPTRQEGYREEGFSASDECDGDLTDKVTRTELEDKIIYSVCDSSGNKATAERQIVYSVQPILTLLGDEYVSFEARMSYTDPGVSAVDSEGNDLSAYVSTEGTVVPYQAGDYEIVYTLTTEQGESVSAVRYVTVLPVSRPETVSPNGKTIYLTFDDGPGPYTNQLLDVLARYNAKATFFVTAQYPKYFDCIGRAYREGHSIGVHTYCHDYYTIYASEEAFFSDFYSMQDVIYNQTGSYTSLYRFPGGSSNTISNFNSGIMSRLTASVSDLGYVYFDWNVSSGDAGETNKTNEVAQNIIDGCSGRNTSIVLQHDIKDYSVNAVEQVLIWGQQNGYSFRALETSSPTAHHGVNN